jgi:hypothetical protein
MKYCKNCNKEIDEHLTYCSYTCRNVFVNKNLRNYNKLSQKIKGKNIENYLKNPIKCLKCGKIIEYEKRRNKYCNHSCAASSINTKREIQGHKLSDVAYQNILEANYKRHKKSIDNYNETPVFCKNCENQLPYSRKKNYFCSQQCKNEFYKKNKSDYGLYRDMCTFKFNLSQYKDEFDFGLIEKYGWYTASNHGGNIDGVSRDHKFSVNEGFKKMINPLILSHPANCELMVHRQNIKKNWRSSITIEKLILNIEEFDKKHGNYYNIPITKFITIEEMRNLSIEYTHI